MAWNFRGKSIFHVASKKELFGLISNKHFHRWDTKLPWAKKHHSVQSEHNSRYFATQHHYMGDDTTRMSSSRNTGRVTNDNQRSTVPSAKEKAGVERTWCRSLERQRKRKNRLNWRSSFDPRARRATMRLSRTIGWAFFLLEESLSQYNRKTVPRCSYASDNIANPFKLTNEDCEQCALTSQRFPVQSLHREKARFFAQKLRWHLQSGSRLVKLLRNNDILIAPTLVRTVSVDRGGTVI